MNIVRWPEPMPESGQLPMAKDAYDWGICKVADPKMSCPQTWHGNRTRMVWVYTRLLKVIRSSLPACHRASSRLLALMCGALALAGCDQPATGPAEPSPHVDARPDYRPSNPAGISALNYTPYYIPGFSITDDAGNGGGGPNVPAADGSGNPAGGGKENCCVMVPKKWHKDMSVTVSWSAEKVADGKTPGTWYRAVATIPPYGPTQYNFWVQFLAGDRIRVRVDDGSTLDKPNDDDVYIVQGIVDQTMTKETQQ